jgi:hypothetical protein
MRRPLAAAALVMALSNPAAAQQTQLPPALAVHRTAPGALAACHPDNMDAAIACIRTYASPADREALLAGDTSSSISGRLNALVRRDLLREGAGSALSRWLEAEGIRNPQLQASVVIGSFIAVERGSSLDLGRIAPHDAALPPATPLERLEYLLGLPTPTPDTPPAGDTDAD